MRTLCPPAAATSRARLGLELTLDVGKILFIGTRCKFQRKMVNMCRIHKDFAFLKIQRPEQAYESHRRSFPGPLRPHQHFQPEERGDELNGIPNQLKGPPLTALTLPSNDNSPTKT